MVIPLLCVRPHPVQPGDGVGMALHKTILVCLPGAPPVSFPGAGDEGLE